VRRIAIQYIKRNFLENGLINHILKIALYVHLPLEQRAKNSQRRAFIA
jgi:hypothetical protein